jgi:hypothetical protein
VVFMLGGMEVLFLLRLLYRFGVLHDLNRSTGGDYMPVAAEPIPAGGLRGGAFSRDFSQTAVLAEKSIRRQLAHIVALHCSRYRVLLLHPLPSRMHTITKGRCPCRLACWAS